MIDLNISEDTLDTEILFADLPSEEESKNIIMIKNDTIWNNILNGRIVEKWLANFKGEVFDIRIERRIALWLLANFVYYNEREVRHFCKTLYKQFIHWATLRYTSLGLSIEDILDKIFQTSKFYHLGNPGESGSFILYYFRQENNLPVSFFTSSPERISHNTENIVIIDDVTVSGQQAISYLNAFNHLNFTNNVIFLTFLSTKDAVRDLNRMQIEVISCSTLDDRSRSFSTTSSTFYHYKNCLEHCKKFALHYGYKARPQIPLGYKNGQYAFGFFYNTPDNTLPMFWSETSNWIPIVKRYDKKYNEVMFNDFGRFI